VECIGMYWDGMVVEHTYCYVICVFSFLNRERWDIVV